MDYLDMMESLKIARKTFTKEICQRTGINEIFEHFFVTKELDMGQLSGYAQLQSQMNQQMMNSQQDQRSAFLAALQNNQGSLGGLGGQALGLQMPNPYINNPEAIYPGKVVHYPQGTRRAFLHDEEIQQLAIIHDFEYNFDSDSFIHKDGGCVTRRMLEGTERKYLPTIFIRAKTPNISWLDDRINEVRIKLI